MVIAIFDWNENTDNISGFQSRNCLNDEESRKETARELIGIGYV